MFTGNYQYLASLAMFRRSLRVLRSFSTKIGLFQINCAPPPRMSVLGMQKVWNATCYFAKFSLKPEWEKKKTWILSDYVIFLLEICVEVLRDFCSETWKSRTIFCQLEIQPPLCGRAFFFLRGGRQLTSSQVSVPMSIHKVFASLRNLWRFRDLKMKSLIVDARVRSLVYPRYCMIKTFNTGFLKWGTCTTCGILEPHKKQRK